MGNTKIKEKMLKPRLKISRRKRRILIEGSSRPENPGLFYGQTLKRIEGLLREDFKNQMTIDFRLLYMNTSSSKWIMYILKTLHALNPDSNLTVNWYYDSDDEAIEEAGEVYQSLLKIPFHLIEK